jgi:hypothetical protein
MTLEQNYGMALTYIAELGQEVSGWRKKVLIDVNYRLRFAFNHDENRSFQLLRLKNDIQLLGKTTKREAHKESLRMIYRNLDGMEKSLTSRVGI